MSENQIPQDAEPLNDAMNEEEIPVSDDYDPALENIRQGFSVKQFIRDAPSIAFSLGVHAVALLILGLWYLPVIVDFVPDLTAVADVEEEIEDIDIYEEEQIEINLDPDAVVSPIVSDMEPMYQDVEVLDPPKLQQETTLDTSDIFAVESTVSSPGLLDGNPLSGRKNKGAAIAGGGGSEASEKAVAMALRWIRDHQLPDGSWSYTQMHNPNCRGQCKDCSVDEANKSRMSATSMALLPMLGSGITHKEGQYRKEVKAGIDYMTANLQMKPEGIILAEPNSYPLMYHHGLATIVVCESAAMTRDRNLTRLAEGAIKYIFWAQDPVGGGWRYSPKQPGDTSGMGWNFMALKSAQMGYIDVNGMNTVIRKTKHFLDNVVGTDGGSKYGYLNNDPNSSDGLKRDLRALTAIGLLGQMYMGWKATDSGLIRGSEHLDNWGPDTGNLYYSYYATQVMHHVGGEKWEKWNKRMRDAVIERQKTEGHERGSWDNGGGGHLGSGGRLSSTCLSTMILEVYYRHLPLYRKTSTVEAFPVD